MESPTVYVLVTDNKFDFYKITDIANNQYQILNRVFENVIVKRIFTFYQLADFLIRDLEKGYQKIQIQIVYYNRDLNNFNSEKEAREYLDSYLIKNEKINHINTIHIYPF